MQALDTLQVNWVSKTAAYPQYIPSYMVKPMRFSGHVSGFVLPYRRDLTLIRWPHLQERKCENQKLALQAVTQARSLTEAKQAIKLISFQPT